jgi:hypothetical protein
MNFLRKAIPELKKLIPFYKNPVFTSLTNSVFDKAVKAQKFILPNGGRIFDTDFKAVPDILNLPFPEIVMEYSCQGLDGGLVQEQIGDASVSAPNRIVFAKQQDNFITVCTMVQYKTPTTYWYFMPYLALITLKSSDNNVLPNPLASKKPIIKSITNNFITVSYYDIGDIAKQRLGDDWEKFAAMDLNDEIGAVLALIEALSCKNVQIEKLPIRKPNKSAAKRGALLFDEYSVLTITRTNNNYAVVVGTHRSPREHLRRGHIRHLSTGNIWVNSTVVSSNAGGKINKIYKLEKEAA